MKNLFKIFSLIFCFSIATFNYSFANDNPLSVVPTNYAGTPGNLTFLGPLATPRTCQLLINSNQLTGLVGQYLTAIAWRIPTSATSAWPAADASFTSYDIYLSQSVPPSERSLTFALNIVGTQTQVRSGGLSIPANSYSFNEIPNRFGPEIMFYTGGHLLIEIRHTGVSGSTRSTDAAGTGVPGYGTDFSGCWQSSYTATTGLQANFSIVQLSTVLTGIGNDPTIVNDYSLKQNYPNPFNPNTLISFSIPANEFVTLKVYDKLGREVATLVNEFKNAGNYSVNFLSENLASGIYFYKIQSGNFTETKKMMLIK
jgi:hypothetical protein